jgi:hypothetical protein
MMLHVEKIFTDIIGIRKNLQNWWGGERPVISGVNVKSRKGLS